MEACRRIVGHVPRELSRIFLYEDNNNALNNTLRFGCMVVCIYVIVQETELELQNYIFLY